MSIIENLKTIKGKGISGFLKKEEEKWKCHCGGVICCHNGICFNCSLDKLKKKKAKDEMDEEKYNQFSS